jgi:hypothetical protein
MNPEEEDIPIKQEDNTDLLPINTKQAGWKNLFQI